MATDMVVIPKSTHNILQRLTGQSRPDIALSLALKDLVRLRMGEAQSHSAEFEKKYGMTFSEFEQAWEGGKIKDAYSYPIEQDYMEWEATIKDLEVLQEISQWQV